MRLHNGRALQNHGRLREETSVDRGPRPERDGGGAENDALQMSSDADVHGASDNPKYVLCEGTAFEGYCDSVGEAQRLGDLEDPCCGGSIG